MKQIKTKQTPLHRSRWALMAIAATLTAVGFLAACTQIDEELPSKENRQIVLNALTKGVEEGGTNLTLYFSLSHEVSAGAYGTYKESYTGTRSAGTGVRPIAYNQGFKYNVGGLKTKATGWYPGNSTAGYNGYFNPSGQDVTWTIDGTQDILIATAQEGSTANPIPPLEFKHCLTQLRFHPYAESQIAIDSWGKITRIEVANQHNAVRYALFTGAVTFTDTADKAIISTGIPAGGAALSLSTLASKETYAAQMGDPMMIAPRASGSPLTLRIFTEYKEMKTITLNRELKAGTPYRLYLRFSKREITIEASVVNDWVEVSTNDKLGHMRVGDYYYTDGTTSPKLVSGNGKIANGVVYYIDPDDPRKFKVMALNGVDQPNTEPSWAASTSYEIGAGARSLDDGKSNTAAVKAYFEANKGGKVTQTTFASAFPAVAWCYEHKGKGNDAPGTWHMPSRHELQYLYCAFAGITPARTWASGGISGGNNTNKDSWNRLLTNAGGTAIGYTKGVVIYWTSTEINAGSVNSIRVSNSELNNSGKKDYPNRVRCVREIAPSPAVGDYYFTDGTTSSKLMSGKTVDGIIYDVDHNNPDKFKLFSPDQDSKWWSQKTTYELGSSGQSNTDGKANVAAMKTYSTNSATAVFATDFPAAEFCDRKNTGGVTGWYLPAKDELAALYTAYKNNKTALDTAISAVPGGVPMGSSYFWSSTEFGATSIAWTVDFTYGNVERYSNKNNNFTVRCIRDIN